MGYVFICVYIIIVYLHTHSRIGFVVNNFYFYIFIHAVSLVLKVRSQRVPVTRSTCQLWRDYLTSRCHQLTMNEAQIDDLKRGLKFGKAIKLPQELMLSARQMCDMLVERETVRQFAHLRCVDTPCILTQWRGLYIIYIVVELINQDVLKWDNLNKQDTTGCPKHPVESGHLPNAISFVPRVHACMSQLDRYFNMYTD